MKDNYGREINYMRISITDKCNLRCKYCMPDGVEIVPMSDLLTFEEIVTICTQAAKLGIQHIKITGGEPLVRRGAPALIGMIKKVPGIHSVSLTTNGVLLEKYLPQLIENGLRSVNVSLDTMDAELYRHITGKDEYARVLSGIRAAREAGLKVKINTVLLKEYNESAWKSMVEYARENPVDVRFIEIMPIGMGKSFHGISNQYLLNCLKKMYPGIEKNHVVHGNGPAVYYSIPGFQGDIGFISAIHGKFCDECNRIRLSVQGALKPCLCYGQTVDLRDILRNQDEESLKQAIYEAVIGKPRAHCFENTDEITETKKMISIGG